MHRFSRCQEISDHCSLCGDGQPRVGDGGGNTRQMHDCIASGCGLKAESLIGEIADDELAMLMQSSVGVLPHDNADVDVVAFRKVSNESGTDVPCRSGDE